LKILDGEREKRTNRLLSDREIRKVRKKKSEVFAIKRKVQQAKYLFRIKWNYSWNLLRRQD